MSDANDSSEETEEPTAESEDIDETVDETNEQPTEVENQDTSEEPEDDDPFPEETPTTIRQSALTYINRLAEIGAELTQVNHNHYPPEDVEEGEEYDEHEGELESIILQFQLNNSNFFVVLPLDEPFSVFQADYDLLEDMVYSSPHQHLGGDFEELEPQQRWASYQTVRQGFEMEQVLGLCQASRNVPIPQLEAWFSLLRSSSDKFVVEANRLQYEFLGGIVQRKVFSSPKEIRTQEFYETVTELLSLRQGVQDILGSAYILSGVQVPNDFEDLHKEVDEADDGPPYSRSFQ